MKLRFSLVASAILALTACGGGGSSGGGSGTGGETTGGGEAGGETLPLTDRPKY